MRAAMRCTAPMKAPSPPPTMPRRMRPPARRSFDSIRANDRLQQGRQLGPNTRARRDDRAAALHSAVSEEIAHPAAGLLDENHPGHDVPGIKMQLDETVEPAAGDEGQ